jgi:anaerobic selenocysteine-containing dehydrogenase
MNPSAEYADIVLPTTSPFEAEGLKVGFETSAEACSLVQLRQQLVPPRGEARPDIAIIFDLACRLGLGEYFWNGDVDTACKTLLEPSGVTLEALRAAPEGLRMPLETRYRKYAEMKDGVPRGFNTPSRRVEFFSETLLDSGYAPLPDYEEPLVSPRSDPELARLYPLVLTCTKEAHYCESQHRGLPSLRRRAPDPQIDLHPQAAAERGIEVGDWVRIETPNGAARTRARFDDMLLPDVVCGQHGWWQACVEVGAPGYPALGDDTANFNLLIGHKAVDPVSGSVPMRAYVCEVRKIVGTVPNAY